MKTFIRGVKFLPKVNRIIERSYKVELSEEEYYALLVLVGGVSYDDFRDLCNARYSARVGRAEPEDFKIIDNQAWSKLYNNLDDSK